MNFASLSCLPSALNFRLFLILPTVFVILLPTLGIGCNKTQLLSVNVQIKRSHAIYDKLSGQPYLGSFGRTFCPGVVGWQCLNFFFGLFIGIFTQLSLFLLYLFLLGTVFQERIKLSYNLIVPFTIHILRNQGIKGFGTRDNLTNGLIV